jgi:hypothetical protein
MDRFQRLVMLPTGLLFVLLAVGHVQILILQ